MWPKRDQWQSLWLRYFSRPAHDRALYRLVRQHRPTRILELGVDPQGRTRRMIEETRRAVGPDVLIRYTGLDPFDLRPTGQASLPFKQAYCQFHRLDARVRLLPGSALAALEQAVLPVEAVDLVLLGEGFGLSELGPAWFYLSRVVGPETQVLELSREGTAKPRWRSVAALEVQREVHAASRGRRRRLAA